MNDAIKYWNLPTEILCGEGAIAHLPERLGLHGVCRPLLVTDPGLLGLEPYALASKVLQEAGVAYDVWSEVSSNPTLDNVRAGARVFSQHGYDGLVALGGGSALDAAKGVALASGDEGRLLRFEWSMAFASYPTLAHFPHLGLPPIVAVPTTAGTGSELGREAVISDLARSIKLVIPHPELMARTAILDPVLTRSLPPTLTAATGMDAVTHHIEAFCSPIQHPMSDGIALEGLRLLRNNLPAAVADGTDLAAREAVLIAAAMAAPAFQKGLGGVHALAHPIGAKHHKHHGLLNAILLPYVLVANRLAVEGAAARMARHLELAAEDFDGLLDWLLRLRSELGIPHTLKEIGLDGSDHLWVGQQAVADISSSDTNPIRFGPVDYAAIYVNAVEGRLT